MVLEHLHQMISGPIHVRVAKNQQHSLGRIVHQAHLHFDIVTHVPSLPTRVRARLNRPSGPGRSESRLYPETRLGIFGYRCSMSAR